ncbi:NPCBM/NEW2 domain-containing protein [Candidatus Daviesbacteria bacterium]|nr:NPCBM/NEW2 domain-containing protein [Candidatus Daviesbacteria bacterium]
MSSKFLSAFKYFKTHSVKVSVIFALVIANISTFSVYVINQSYLTNEPQVLGKAIDAAKARASNSPKPTKAPKPSKAPKSKPSPSPTPTPWPTDSSLYQEYYLSDIPWVSATNREGQGPVEKDKSNKDEKPGGNTITLNGKTFSKGLGVHAESKIIYNIKAQCSRFNAIVGLDDEAGPLGSVIFVLKADKDEIGKTETMRGNTTNYAMYKDIPPGTLTLELKVNTADGPPGFTYSDDHADWADAKVKCLKGAFGAGASPSPSPGGVNISTGDSDDPFVYFLDLVLDTSDNFKSTLVRSQTIRGRITPYLTIEPPVNPLKIAYRIKLIDDQNKKVADIWREIGKADINGTDAHLITDMPYIQNSIVKIYIKKNNSEKLIYTGKMN